jgi:hypothetical protein
MLAVLDPLAGDETGQQRRSESAGMALVDLFDAGGLAQFGLAPVGGEAAILPLGALAVHEEPQALCEAEGRDLRHLHLLQEGLGPPRQAQGVQLLERRLVSHRHSPGSG